MHWGFVLPSNFRHGPLLGGRGITPRGVGYDSQMFSLAVYLTYNWYLLVYKLTPFIFQFTPNIRVKMF